MAFGENFHSSSNLEEVPKILSLKSTYVDFCKTLCVLCKWYGVLTGDVGFDMITDLQSFS